MNELVSEWIKKAEGDYHTALREFRARKFPNYDAAGFHAQQCVEKYLKAILQQQNLYFEKVHDLLALLNLCLPIAPELELFRNFFAILNPFSVAYRYPGETANKQDAREAITALIKLRTILRNILNLD